MKHYARMKSRKLFVWSNAEQVIATCCRSHPIANVPVQYSHSSFIVENKNTKIAQLSYPFTGNRQCTLADFSCQALFRIEASDISYKHIINSRGGHITSYGTLLNSRLQFNPTVTPVNPLKIENRMGSNSGKYR